LAIKISSFVFARWILTTGIVHTVGDGGIYPRHEFDMGGYPHQLFWEICFLVLKI
jgi:hypothetical protein